MYFGGTLLPGGEDCPVGDDCWLSGLRVLRQHNHRFLLRCEPMGDGSLAIRIACPKTAQSQIPSIQLNWVLSSWHLLLPRPRLNDSSSQLGWFWERDGVCLLVWPGYGGSVDGARLYSPTWTRDVPVSGPIDQWLGVEGAYWRVYGIWPKVRYLTQNFEIWYSVACADLFVPPVYWSIFLMDLLMICLLLCVLSCVHVCPGPHQWFGDTELRNFQQFSDFGVTCANFTIMWICATRGLSHLITWLGPFLY